jgi:transposase
MSTVPHCRELLHSLGPLKLLNLTKTDEGWIVEAEGHNTAVCPDCQTRSRSRHSRYGRSLRDLPLQGASVILNLHLSRWRCRAASCNRKIFGERLPELCLPNAQRTVRSGHIVELLGHALGGRPAQRLAKRLGMAASRDTLLRHVKKMARRAIPAPPVRILGVDDWAWRKGHSYGTILVDLERRCVIDVLPDRSADSFADWLTEHPDIVVVSRDRLGLYAEGTRRGAPQAVQVADRFHLIQNLVEAVEAQLTPMLDALLIPVVASPAGEVPVVPATDGTIATITERQSAQQAQRAVVQAWFEQVMTLHRQGRNNQQIMRATGIGRCRVETWTRLGYLPERRRMEPRPGMPAAFRDYLAQRWNQGCRRVKDLLKEVQEQGYIGSYSALDELLSPWRSIPPVSSLTHNVPIAPVVTPSRRLAPQVAAALLSKHPGEFTGQQAQTVATLKGNNPQIGTLRRFLLRFRGLLRGSSKAKLQQWMKDVENSGFERLERFVQFLRRDEAAVENAVTMPWSNGQVEGQVNKLKALKRQMYGRGSTELLRARLLPVPAS